MTAAATPGGDRDELRALLAELYPGDVALGLLELCGPRCDIHHGAACTAPGKRPLASGWTAEAAARWADPDADPERWRARMADHLARGGNIGWCPPARVLVLDADTREAVAYLARALPDAPVQATAHGAHYVVWLPDGVTVSARTGVALAPGIAVDLRPGGRAQIVVAPSAHASGHVYTWQRSLPADLAELPEIPAGLLAALVADEGARDREHGGDRDGAGDGDEIPAGRRNATLASLAGTMRRRGMSAEEILAALHAVNARRCRPPLSAAEVAAIARSVGRYPPGEGAGAEGEGGEQAAGAGEEPRPALDLASVAFSGARLRALRQRPEAVSPLPGILDPEPHLHVLLGKPKSGKTTFGLDLARNWAQGIAPWTGAEALPGTRALVVSREQPVTRIDATMRRLARYAGTGDTWADRVAIVARDRELPAEARRLLTLDADGLAALRGALELARERGEPYGLVLLDSLSRLKPASIEERDNDLLTEWLDALEEIASACGVWLVLIHHVGHTSDASRAEARSAGRGASSISAVAQVVLLYERVARSPRLRRLLADGNAILPAEYHYEVAGARAETGSIHYHRPADALAGHDPRALLADGPVSLTGLAWRLAGEEPVKGRKPPGAAMRLAGQLTERWERAGIAVVADGAHGARMVTLAAMEEP
ncbi:MAG: AAA family ATPase [Deltaproteobacteria bacterium]|nr:AAA family ATPase [Deltaproteobacteria bacterium]